VKNPYTSVLIVEDDRDWQAVFREAFKSQGYHLEVVSSFKESRRILTERTFDVAIIDIRLNEDDPDDNSGLNVLALILGTRQPTSIIITGAYADVKLVKTLFREYEIFDIWMKDRTLNELIEMVQKAIQRSQELQNANIANSQASDIFISYARVDDQIVQNIYDTLVMNKYHPWMDIHSIKGGEDWIRAIYKAIEESHIFLAVLSNNSVSRRGVIQKELKKALDKWDGMLPDDIYIIPVRVDDCPIPDLLMHIQVLDWNGGKGENKLLEAINLGLARRSRK